MLISFLYLIYLCYSCFFCFHVISRVQSFGVCLLTSSVCIAHMLRDQEREGNGRSDRKQKSFVRVCAKLFWRKIYCANPIPETDSQSVSIYHIGLGRQDPRIICEYDLATAIAIRPLTHTHRWEMGSSIFDAMSWLKFASTTRESFTRIPPTEINKGEKCFRWSWKLLPFLSLFYLYHQARSVFIGSFLWMSHNESPSLTPIMASDRLYHIPQIRKSPLFYNPPPPWRT